MTSRTMTDAYMLRLPDGWRSLLKQRAAKNRRSLNQEILTALEPAITDSEAAQSSSDEGQLASVDA